MLHLDDRSLELTEDCAGALSNVNSVDSLIKFHHDYVCLRSRASLPRIMRFKRYTMNLTCGIGHFFATNVELGGKLFASEQFSSSETGEATERANAMKASASASFSYGSFQADAIYSQESQSKVATTSQESRMAKSLSWEARGGDSILCNK